jgi:hypothetical protein
MTAFFTGFALDEYDGRTWYAALAGLWWPISLVIALGAMTLDAVSGAIRRYMTSHGARMRRLDRKRRELEMLREERELDEKIDAELQKMLGAEND